MDLTEKIINLKEEMLKTENLNHMDYIAKKYMKSNISLRKKKKLFFTVLLEIKQERKKLRKKYLEEKETLKFEEKAKLLKKEAILKNQIQILKFYCEKIKIEQKRNKQEEQFMQPVPFIDRWIEEKEMWDDNNYINHPKCQEYLACFEKHQPLVIEDPFYCFIAYRYFLRKANLLNYRDVIMIYTKQILSEIRSLDEERQLIELNSIIDNIKYKKAEYKDKNDLNVKLEKEILKEIKKEVKKIIKNIKYKQADTYDYRYDIMNYFIINDGNYYYIKKMLEQMPDVINLRSYDKEHLLVKVIKLLIYNLKIELRSQDPNFINRDYYKKIYFLMRNQDNIELTEEDFLQIANLLDEMIGHLLNNRYENTRKAKALTDLNDIKDNIKTNHNQKNKQIFQEQLNNEIFTLPYKINSALNEKDRVNLTGDYLKNVNAKTLELMGTLNNKEIAQKLGISNHDITNSLDFSKTILFEGNKFAYSITRDDKYNYLFRIHSLDIASLLDSESMLDNSLYNQIFGHKEVSLSKLLKIHEADTIPTITYQLKISPNGYISTFHMFTSKITIDRIYHSSELKQYRKDETLKEFVKIYRILNPNDTSELTVQKYNDMLHLIISQRVISYAYQFNIPLIIQGQNNLSNLEYLELNKGMGYLLSKVDKETFNKISHIITNDIDEKHYSVYPFDGENNINILGDLNYEHLLIQRIVKDMIKQIDPKKIIDRYQEDCENLTKVLNESINYVQIEQNKFKSYHKKKELKLPLNYIILIIVKK